MRFILPLLLSLLAVPAAAKPLTQRDLSTIPVGPKPGQTRALVHLHKWGPAIKRITGRSPEAHFVRGWLHAQAEQNAQVVTALKAVPRKLPLLADRARILSGEALLALEQWPQAAKMVEPITGDGPSAYPARRILARALRESGKLDAARIIYQLIVNSADQTEVPVGLLGLGLLEIEADRAKEAMGHLLRIDQEFPSHWAGRRARDTAQMLLKVHPELGVFWNSRSIDQQLERGYRLSEAGWHTTVIQAMEPLSQAKLNVNQTCQQRYFLGRAQWRRRKFKQALATMEVAVKACTKAKSEHAPWARHIAGKLHERLAKEDSAGAHYRAQLKHSKGHRLADDAGFFLVRHLLEDKNDFERAHKTAQMLAKTYPEGDMTPEAIFWVFVRAFSERRYKVARKVLALSDTLKPHEGFRPRDSGRVQYWKARLDQEAGKRKRAIMGFQQTMKIAPLSWYAIMAYSRLVELDRKHAKSFAKRQLTQGPGRGIGPNMTGLWSTEVPAKVQGNAWEQARLLARLGLAEPAWDALKNAGADESTGNLPWLSAWLLDQAGAPNISHDIMRRKRWQFRWLAPLGAGAVQWKVAYPQPFERLVRKAAKGAGIDHAFIWGIMREESGFNPGIESHAAAVGLLQLILPTAKRMRKKGEKQVTKTRLKDPEVNIPLGARYLAHVKEYTGGQWALVPAGYNAGAGALSKWLKQRGHLPLDLFVETIPYEEARWYTKRVVASWATYRALYDNKKYKNPLPYVSQRTRAK
jgi:soluble lytic murein transglycosylase